MDELLQRDGCYCLCKDTNSQASHNRPRRTEGTPIVVIAYAKILILKQVTTRVPANNSQERCYCLCKDTNSQASHNKSAFEQVSSGVVIAYAKILILKQVTTDSRNTWRPPRLLLPMQRY